MKKKIQLLVLSVLCTVFAQAQYVAPSEGVFRIINVGYNAALMEDFLGHTLHCTANIGDNNDYEQLWILKTSGSGYSLQNLFTGAYIQTGNTGTEVNYWTGSTAKTFNIVAAGNGNAYNIWDPTLGAQGLHSKGANGNVVRWVDCDPSRWRFVKVELTEQEIEAAREKYARLTGGDKLEGYQTVLNEVFVDKACTMLNQKYAAMSATEIEAALNSKLPTELVAMAVKVKNNAWAEANEKANKPGWDANYAKKFRVQMIEPHSIAGEITEWIGHQGHTNMDNPTGLYANKREVLYIMVEGDIKEGSELWATWLVGHTKMNNYNNGYTNGIRLHEGLNIVPMGSDGSALYFNYLVHTFNKSTWKFTNKLSDYDDLKIHVEGGYINGYYNVAGDALYTPDNDDDWVYYEERANLENITILGRYEVLQFELNDVVNYTDDKGNTWSEKGLAYHFPERLPTEMPNSPAFTAPNQRINGIVEAWDRIFLSEKMTLGVASKADVDSMNKLFPRWDATWTEKAEIYNYDDKLLAFCDSLNDRDGDYGEYYNHRGVAFGTRTGYMYGSWDHSGYHINTTPSIMTAIATEAGPTWGPAHEIGHQHQALYTLNGEMEVTNNTFANVAAWYMGMGTSRVNGTQGNLAHVYENLRDGGYLLSNNIWALTQRYYRLWLYYHRAGNNTQFFPRLFELLRKNPMERSYGSSSEMRPNDKGVMENVGFQLTNGYRSYLHFYKLCCEAAQEDLTEFFRAYGCFVPVDGVFQGDYTNSKYYTTQEEIDRAIAEVKAKGYPVNNKVLFINDCTKDVTYGHDGKTPREYWDGETGRSQNGELGYYVDFLAKSPISGKYLYTLSDLSLNITGGKGAVGFAIYNNDKEIIAFSNNHSFVLNKEVATLLRGGNATLVAVAADGNDVEVPSKAEGGSETDQYNALNSKLTEAKKYLALTDATGEKAGLFIPDSTQALAEVIAKAEKTLINNDQTEGTYGEWYTRLDKELIILLNNMQARVPLYANCYYTIFSKENSLYSICYASAGLKATTAGMEEYENQWLMEPASEEGVYYLKSRASGYYISAANDGVRARAAAKSTSSALAFRLVAGEPGEFMLQRTDAENIYLCFDKSSRQLKGGKGTSASAHWSLVLADDMLSLPEEGTDGKVIIYHIQCVDNGSYLYKSSNKRTEGRVVTGQYTSADDTNYWFYFTKGGIHGDKYRIYNYATGKSVTLENGNYYTNKDIDVFNEYTFTAAADRSGLTVSSADGNWYVAGSNLTANATEQSRFRLIKIGEATNTSIEMTEVNTEANDIYYDLTGRIVPKPTKGIYIHQGKKVMIK